jgi:hypothetical protein
MPAPSCSAARTPGSAGTESALRRRHFDDADLFARYFAIEPPLP